MLMQNPLTLYSKMAEQWVPSAKLGKICTARRTPLVSRRMIHLYIIKECRMKNKALSSSPLSFSLPSAMPVIYRIPSQQQKLLSVQMQTANHFLFYVIVWIYLSMSRVALSSEPNYFPLGILQNSLHSPFLLLHLLNTHSRILLILSIMNISLICFEIF